MMREMTGLQDVYIAILSATLAEDPVDVAELGADACIAKGPFTELAEHILMVLRDPECVAMRCLSGEVIGMESIHPRRMTRELLSIKKHCDAILERISQGIVEMDRDGRILFANTAALSLIAVPEAHLLGARFVDLFGETDRQRVLRKDTSLRGLRHHDKGLYLVHTTDGDDDSSVRFELLDEGGRHMTRCRRHDDRIVGRVLLPPEITVPPLHMHTVRKS